MQQLAIEGIHQDRQYYRGAYSPVITAVMNNKGVLDVDTVKGCALGMAAYPNGGCYGECYTRKNAAMYGIDSRDKNGAYYCSESETKMFFKENGLHVYNKIVYLESEFTRLAHAKKTLNMRKFPKCEQKIIVAYKGNISKIKDKFPPIGRL